MTGRRKKLLTAAVFAMLAFGSLQFVAWISQMAFENTCIELQEQYIGAEVREVIGTIENSVNFGKELKNYYGMEELLEDACKISEGNLKAVVLDEEGEPLYLSFPESEENRQLLAQIYAEDYQAELTKAGSNAAGEIIGLNGQESFVFPICREQKELVGYFLTIYQKKALLEGNEFNGLEREQWFIWGCTSVFLAIFFLVKKDGRQERRYRKYMPVIVIMFGMFANMLFMYQDYKGKYSDLVSHNAESAAVHIQSSVNALLEKGLPVAEIYEVSDYLDRKAEGNAAMESIAIVKSYYNTSESAESGDGTVWNLDLLDGQAQLNVVVSQSYITDKVFMMTITFGAVFVICLMITYELTYLAEIISVRVSSKRNNRQTPGQIEDIGVQVKLLSFLAYTAIYTSMSYTAVIMRNWDASLFGFSKAVSASLPLTVELLCIMVCSVIVQKVFKDTKLNYIMLFASSFLILGNAACITASSPYILLFLRALCGIGFGFLKYGLNAIVSAGSRDSEAVGSNYAKLNAGLLGGITVGASLGAILAQSLGYQFNYLFTAVLCVLALLFADFAIPWRMLDIRRGCLVEDAGGKPVRMADVFKDRTALKAIILGDIPLNIGLMYVVAFLPVYMNHAGYPAVAASYAYLVNGLAGVYLGAVMMDRLRGLPKKLACVLALLLGASGILLLVLGSAIGMVLLSAGIMGLFDGYGTPTITSFFTGLPQVQRADTASMLTVFNSVGSAVQIICPVLYNMLIQPDGDTGRLFLLGIGYVAAAVLFLCLFRKKELA